MNPNTLSSALAQAPAARSEATPQILHLVFPADEEGEATRVRYSLTDDTFMVTYEITSVASIPRK